MDTKFKIDRNPQNSSSRTVKCKIDVTTIGYRDKSEKLTNYVEGRIMHTSSLLICLKALPSSSEVVMNLYERPEPIGMFKSLRFHQRQRRRRWIRWSMSD